MQCSVMKQSGAMFSEEWNLVKLENKYLDKGVFIVESLWVSLFICNTNGERKTTFRVFLGRFDYGLLNMFFIVLSSD